MKTQTPEKSTPQKSELLNDIKTFSQSQPLQTPGIDQQTPGDSPQGQTLNESDFLNTGSHAKEGTENGAGATNQTNATPITPGQGQQKTSNVLGNSGKLAVTLIHDTIIPALFVWVLAMFKKELDKDALRLTKEDREVLTPAWQDYLNSVNISFDKPIYQLLVAIGFTYGAKFMDGSVKIRDKKAAPATSASDAITKIPETVTKENFKDVYEIERENLIMQTQKEKRQKREKIIDFLSRSGAFARLKKALEKRYNLTPAA